MGDVIIDFMGDFVRALSLIGDIIGVFMGVDEPNEETLAARCGVEGVPGGDLSDGAGHECWTGVDGRTWGASEGVRFGDAKHQFSAFCVAFGLFGSAA